MQQRQRNQHKPCPPADELKPVLTFFYNLGLNDGQIAHCCIKHFDVELYGLSISSVKRFRKQWGLLSTRQQGHTMESIAQYVDAIKAKFPHRGADSIRKSLILTFKVHAPRALVAQYLRQIEPEAVQARRHRRFKRRRFWATGVHDIWAQDQHDKWGRFGLYLHVSVDTFSGYINWMKIWWNNSNPRLITGYYIEAIRKLKAVPLVTQSDPGSENFGVANAHTTIRHRLDPSLADTLQHRWMRAHMNIKPEIMWSVLNSDFKPGFEEILQYGVDQGWYDVNSTLEVLIFRWLAIPWLQAELDDWTKQFNLTPRRANKHKSLPHGIPILIVNQPQDFNAVDFKVNAPADLIDEVERQWAPPTHPIFELVPSAFEEHAQTIYNEIGRPGVHGESFWDVYLQMLDHFNRLQGNAELSAAIAEHAATFDRLMNEKIEVLPGLRDLRNGDVLIGKRGSSAPEGNPDDLELADFTDSEEDEEDEDHGWFH
ncbi:uncharacterized protein LAESUDRAFT_810391 [Laetiporus sulphureus 93-53]|uniref:Integrase core domain-containing protein n=1 Tax=Laetiporus sulphureus 93-53 TaxID=1314785 RepID=A0A165GBJ4_9APHY|nr:uncharacterized protein LAESUDRAFT_810391 [Laetiporus sulphureus 93-53]KZT10115.1 hypothetical protein LAESUDRAFT_810391 [Laetiporus sulphureus 93-53]